jgi:hypothetical protein
VKLPDRFKVRNKSSGDIYLIKKHNKTCDNVTNITNNEDLGQFPRRTTIDYLEHGTHELISDKWDKLKEKMLEAR